MDDSFDGYRKWLGIPPEEQPPHHYRLLGIAIFEDDPDVIENAANRQMTHVRTFQSGRYSKLSQTILNQLSTAKICLLNADKKSAYDVELKAKLRTAGQPAGQAAAPPPKALPPQAPPAGQLAPPATVATPPAAPPVGSPLPVGSPMPNRHTNRNGGFAAAASPVATPVQAVTSVANAPPSFVGPAKTTKSVGQRARSRRKSSPWPMLLGIVAVIALLGVVIVAVNHKPKKPADQGDEAYAEPVPPVAPSVPDTTPQPNPNENVFETPPSFPPNRRPIDTGDDEFLASPPKKLRKSESFENVGRRREVFRESIEAAMQNVRNRDIEGARRELVKIREDDLTEQQRNQLIRTSQIVFRIEDVAKAAFGGASALNRRRLEDESASFEFLDHEVKLLWFEDGHISYTFGDAKVEAAVTKIPTMHVVAFASLEIDSAAPEVQAKIVTFLLLDTLSTAFEKRLGKEWAKRLWNDGYSDEQLRWVVDTFGDQLESDQSDDPRIEPSPEPKPAVEPEGNPFGDDPFGVGKPGENPFEITEPKPAPANPPTPDDNPFF